MQAVVTFVILLLLFRGLYEVFGPIVIWVAVAIVALVSYVFYSILLRIFP